MPEAAATSRARRLRAEQSPAERSVWSRLRNRRSAGWKFRRQAPIDRFVVDFVCSDAWLIVEHDGGQHSEDTAAARDRARTVILERCGYLVVRFWSAEVFSNLDGVCETILAMLQGAKGV